jgi:hypothetical protein
MMFEFNDENLRYPQSASANLPLKALSWESDESEENAFVRLPIAVVWDRIAPAVPDSLIELRGGIYEARWWTPVPRMDVETLLATEGIVIIGRPYEPDDLPMGCAVRFGFAPPRSDVQTSCARLGNPRFGSLSLPPAKWFRLHLC